MCELRFGPFGPRGVVVVRGGWWLPVGNHQPSSSSRCDLHRSQAAAVSLVAAVACSALAARFTRAARADLKLGLCLRWSSQRRRPFAGCLIIPTSSAVSAAVDIQRALREDVPLRMLVAQREQTYVQAALIAWIHIGQGEYNAAFDWLERALEERSALLISLPSFGFWDPIRSDERFTQLLDRMGLAAKGRLPPRELLLPESEFGVGKG